MPRPSLKSESQQQLVAAICAVVVTLAARHCQDAGQAHSMLVPTNCAAARAVLALCRLLPLLFLSVACSCPAVFCPPVLAHTTLSWKTPQGVFQAYSSFWPDGYTAQYAWAAAWMCKYDTAACPEAISAFNGAMRINNMKCVVVLAVLNPGAVCLGWVAVTSCRADSCCVCTKPAELRCVLTSADADLTARAGWLVAVTCPKLTG